MAANQKPLDLKTFLTSRTVVSNAVAGAVADAISTVVLYPLDTIKLMMQLDSRLRLKDIIKQGNFVQLYKGIDSKLFQSVQQKFQFFYSYAALKILYQKNTGSKPGVAADLFIGYMAAFQGLGTTLPLEKVTQRIVMSTRSSGDDKHYTFFQHFWSIAKNEGMASFYNTIMASAILCINPAITYVVFEQLKTRVLGGRPSQVLSTLEAFVLGALSKAVATICTFPAIRVKVVMNGQRKSKSANDQESKSMGMADTFKDILARDGAAGLYCGIGPQLTKGVLNAALMLAIKERVYRAVHTVMTGSTTVATK